MTNQQLLVVSTLAYIVSSISFICTVITLVLIKVMKKWNGFLAILWSMALCQLIFDVSFSRHITSDTSWVSSKSDFTTELWDGLQFFGGLSVSLWTNVLAFVVVKVVVTFEGFNIRKNFYTLSAVVLVPSILMGALNIAFYQDGGTGGQEDRMGMIYTYSRTLSIILNFVAYGVIAMRARKITNLSGEESPQQLMINELSRRMIYYPLMQTVSRIGATIYEPMYGYGPYLGHTSQREFSLACLYATTAPAAGIGYLIIFLLMQPYAYEQFVAILTTCRPIAAPESSLASSSRDNRKYSADTESDGAGSSSHKSPSSNGFSQIVRGSAILSRAAHAMGRSREDSVIKYLDDDELIRAIKESWKAATRRNSFQQRAEEDRGSLGSSMHSSIFSRATDFSDGSYHSASLSTHPTSSSASMCTHPTSSSVEMSSVESFQTAQTSIRSPIHPTALSTSPPV